MNSPRRPSLVGPVLLIGLGALLLLQNLGYLPFGLWSTLWRLWPLILIVVGLDLLIGRCSALGSLAAVGLTALLVAGALFWSARYRGQASGAGAEPVTVRQPVGDADSAEVRLEFGAGQLNVEKAEGERYLVDGTATTAVRSSYSVTGGVGRLELRQESRDFFIFPPFGDAPAPVWDLGLAGTLPLGLTVETGAGEATIDLTGLTLTQFDLNTGVGATRVTFPAEGQIEASISGGVGELRITIPEGMPARLTVSTGVGDFSVSSTFTRRDDTYETADFSTAGDYLELDLSLGIGSVVVSR